MDYNYSNNHEDNFQDESAEIIGYCGVCDCEIKINDPFYNYYEYDMICSKCIQDDSIAQCEKCNTYFKIEDLTKYECGSKTHYLCKSDANAIDFSDEASSSEQI
ncbi:MAG: hypothetical protein ACI4PU_09705 [Intestinibacter sp.]